MLRPLCSSDGRTTVVTRPMSHYEWGEEGAMDSSSGMVGLRVVG